MPHPDAPDTSSRIAHATDAQPGYRAQISPERAALAEVDHFTPQQFIDVALATTASINEARGGGYILNSNFSLQEERQEISVTKTTSGAPILTQQVAVSPDGLQPGGLEWYASTAPITRHSQGTEAVDGISAINPDGPVIVPVAAFPATEGGRFIAYGLRVNPDGPTYDLLAVGGEDVGNASIIEQANWEQLTQTHPDLHLLGAVRK